jgi:ketosteroid isomerase-like protein
MTNSLETLRPVDDPWALTDLCNSYAFAVDTKDIEGIGRCFTEDAVFDQRPTGVESVVHGRESIQEMFRGVYANTRARWHGVSNLRFHAIDDDHAVGTPYFVAVADINGGGRLTYNGYWDDRYHRIDGVWLIASRILRPLVEVERGGFDLAGSPS